MSSSNPKLAALTESLRAARDARGGRARGHARHGAGVAAPSCDEIVQQTDEDAAGSRLSAVQQGYLHDHFTHFFAKTQAAIRRQPIINRGTYVRTVAIDTLLDVFLDQHVTEPCQVISLGAGTDTRFFRTVQKRPDLAVKYHELDFPATTARKIQIIKNTPTLAASASPTNSPNDSSMLSDRLQIHGLDLRELASFSTYTIPDLEPSLPTMIISEMCLAYLPAPTSSLILRNLLQQLPTSRSVEILLYEPLNPNDAFGRTMVQNLAARSIELPGMLELPDLEAHRERLRDVGFKGGSEEWNVRQIWDGWISSEEKERLRGCEMVDEEEEWYLLSEHYGLIWGRRGGEAIL